MSAVSSDTAAICRMLDSRVLHSNFALSESVFR